MKEEETYLDIASKIKGAEQSKMFGKPCLKVNGKAFACFFENEMVFKLDGDRHKQAIALKGAQLFDPSGKKRPMKEWVQVPFAHKARWEELAKEAFKYVKAASK